MHILPRLVELQLALAGGEGWEELHFELSHGTVAALDHRALNQQDGMRVISFSVEHQIEISE